MKLKTPEIDPTTYAKGLGLGTGLDKNVYEVYLDGELFEGLVWKEQKMVGVSGYGNGLIQERTKLGLSENLINCWSKGGQTGRELAYHEALLALDNEVGRAALANLAMLVGWFRLDSQLVLIQEALEVEGTEWRFSDTPIGALFDMGGSNCGRRFVNNKLVALDWGAEDWCDMLHLGRNAIETERPEDLEA